MSSDWYQDLVDWHAKFGAHTENFPTIPPDDVKELRASLISEEVTETLKAMNVDDIVEIADGIADSIYVLLGTAVSYGIDMKPVWDEVQRTNMAKEGGAKRADGKILKPEGWTPPDIAGIIESQRL